MIILPLSFRVQGIGLPPFDDVDVLDQVPSDDFSYNVTTLGVASGAITVTTKDAFPELLTVTSDSSTSGGGDKLDLESITHLANGRWRFGLRQYTLVAGAYQQRYASSKIYMSIFLRNSSVKF